MNIRRDFTYSWRLRNNNKNFYLNVTEWLASPGGTKFSKPIEEILKKELNVFRRSICMSARNKDGTLSVDKSPSMKSIWEPPLIVSFARWLSVNRFPLSDPAFTEAHNALEHLQKTSEKNRQHCRPNRAHKKRSETNFQWTMYRWRNCLTAVSLDRQRAKSHKTSEDDLVLPQPWSTSTRDSTPANANNSVVAKNPSRSWVFWWARSVGSNLYQPGKTIRV